MGEVTEIQDHGYGLRRLESIFNMADIATGNAIKGMTAKEFADIFLTADSSIMMDKLSSLVQHEYDGLAISRDDFGGHDPFYDRVGQNAKNTRVLLLAEIDNVRGYLANLMLKQKDRA